MYTILMKNSVENSFCRTSRDLLRQSMQPKRSIVWAGLGTNDFSTMLLQGSKLTMLKVKESRYLHLNVLPDVLLAA